MIIGLLVDSDYFDYFLRSLMKVSANC